MTSLDKLLFQASQGLFPPIEGGVDIDTLRLTDKQIDGVTIVTDADGKIKVSDNFVGNGTTQPVKVADVDGLQALLDDKAQLTHEHTIADITDLEEYVDRKVAEASLSGDITLEDASLTTKGITQLSNAIDSIEENKSSTPLAVSTALNEAKDYTNTEITKLTTSSETKYAKIIHKHEIDDVNDLQIELDKKALKTDFNNLKNNFDTHIHEIADVTNLQDRLDQKAPLTHTHNWTQIANRPTSTSAQIDNAVANSHIHTNRTVLDDLEDGNGILIYKGNPLGETAYLSVQDITERDAIPMEARKEGLMVLVVEDGGMYYLKGGIDNAFWEIFATGAGGATNASTLPATPFGKLSGTNTQSLIDELETKKADKNDVYSKAETENFIKAYPVDYLTLENLPDLSTLHGHENKETLDLFSQFQGNLTWKGKTLGDLVTEIYDANKDGVIDLAQKLEGLNATTEELNYVSGATGNLQAQINSLSSGVTFRGEYSTYADMIASLPNPNKGDLVYIKADENKNGAVDTQYVYDGTTFVYGGGTTKTPDASLTTKGVIQLGGDLSHPSSTATAPKLTSTGVTAGLYRNALLTIGEDGRVTHAEDGEIAFLNDTIVSDVEGWTSQKIDTELSKKAEKNHTHEQLHNKNVLASVTVSDELPNDKYVLTYNQAEGKANWQESQGGKFMVGNSVIIGDLKLIGGSYISLGIDPLTNAITINSTYREGGSANLQTGFEIRQTVEIEGGGKSTLSVPSTYNKYMLHTMQLLNDKNSVGEIRLYSQSFNEDGSNEGFIEYNSNPELTVSDIVNIPIFDYDNSKMMHVEIINHSPESAKFTFRAKCTNLL